MRWVFFFLFGSHLLFCFPASASSTTDSLTSLLQQQPSDSLRLRLLSELAFSLQSSDLFASTTYAEEALALAERQAAPQLQRELHTTLAINHYHLGNLDKTLAYFQEVLSQYEEEQDEQGMAKLYNNLGILYDELKDYGKAIRYYTKALRLKQKLKDSLSLSSTLSNLGITYLNQHNPEQARTFFEASRQIDEKASNTYGLIYTYENLGRLMSMLKKPDSARYYYTKSLSLIEGSDYRYEEATITNSLAKLFLQENQYHKAVAHFKEGLQLAQKAGARQQVTLSLEGLANAYARLNNYPLAYNYYQQYTSLRDSIFNEEQLKKIHTLETNFQIQEREKEIEILRKDAQISSLHLERNKMLSYSLMSGLLLFALGLLYYYQQNRQKRRSNALLAAKNQEIARSNADMTSSIEYARTLQNCVFPQEEALCRSFQEAMVYSKARNIVNGDFFWFYANPNFKLLVVVDCTGHGVPAAFMTLMGKSLLDQLVVQEKIHDPADLLMHIQLRLQNTLNQSEGSDGPADGMDLCLLKIMPGGKAVFAGAKRSLYLIRQKKLQVLKPQNPILCGPLSYQHNSFIQQKFSLQAGDRCYMFTDGITDQFGGRDNKKLLKKRLQNWLISHQDYPLFVQKQHFTAFMNRWQGTNEQTDDQLLVAIQL